MSDTDDIQDRISRRAHEIWEREGHPHGRHDEHWAQAEAEIRAETRAEGGTTGGKPASTRKSASKGTRAAAEDLSAVEAGDPGPKASGKAATAKPAAGKAAGTKATGAKPQRTPRKDGGKSASPG